MNVRQTVLLAIAFSSALTVAAPPSLSAQESRTSFHMLDHMDRVTELRMAIVAGDLTAARGPAAWLATHQPDRDLEAKDQVYITEMQTAAGNIVEDWSVDDAAMELASLGGACGNCHIAAERPIDFNPGSPPQESSQLQAHMALHLWAVDRLWEGVVGPSDASWQAGSAALNTAHLSRDETTAPAGRRYRAESFAELVHELGGLAADTPPDQRAMAFGRVVQACTGCHTLIGTNSGS